MRPSRMAAIVSRWNAGQPDARFSCPNGLMHMLLSRRPRSGLASWHDNNTQPDCTQVYVLRRFP